MSALWDEVVSSSDESLWRAAVLASLPQITPRRLSMMFSAGGPDEVWETLRGELPVSGAADAVSAVVDGAQMGDLWRSRCSSESLVNMRDVCLRHGIGVTYRGHHDYPSALLHDHQPPAVLFYRGSLAVIAAHRRCGIVGTRSATPLGRRFAERLGGDLAASGVSVVSGLAKGIDAAAHSGTRDCLSASSAPHAALGAPIAVVANGLDTVYPRHHTALFDFVSANGVIISESAPGTPPEPFRFPLRNRIIAALSEVLVVVESRAAGGSMHTVDAAMMRGVPVLAVPGAPGAAASVGTNRLISEGCAPCVHVDDALVALGLHGPIRQLSPHVLDHDSQHVLQALVDGPMALDALVQRTGFELIRLVRVLGGLEARGLVAHEAGWWQGVIAM